MQTPQFEYEITPMDDVPGDTIEEKFQHMIDNCEECKATRARGEKAIIFGPQEIAAAVANGRRDVIRYKRPRWRHLKRRR